MESKKPPNLILPLPIFLEIYLQDTWCKPIDINVGKVLHTVVDKQENYCHVEFYDPTNFADIESSEIMFECKPTPKNPAILWRIKEWRESVSYWQRRRDAISKDTEIYNYYKKKIAELSLKIHEMTALPFDGYAIPLATKIVTSKNVTGARNFGVELEIK